MSFPIPPDEAERLQELRRYGLLDSPPESSFDNITALAARLFEMPMATVTLIDEHRQWFKSHYGIEVQEVTRDHGFSSHAIAGSEVLVVPDARADPRFSENLVVIGPPQIRFYAGAPLRMSSGVTLGTLSVLDRKPREFPPANITALEAMAALVVDAIQLRYVIGDRRRHAENLRLLLEAVHQSSDSIMITKADLDSPEILFVNTSLTKLSGYPAAEVIGQTPRIFQGPKTDRAVLDRIRANLAEGREFHGETVNYRKDGSEFVVAMHISPIRDENGKVTHFIGFQSDATEKNRVDIALQEAKDEAERANRAKSEFLSRMSHELRTPLHAILGFAQLLDGEGKSAEEADNVAQIIRAGNHLLGLINEVLDMARVESGKLALTPEPVNVRPILEESLSLVRPLAAQRGVHLDPLAGDVDCVVRSSGRRFKQVMLNLLSNAVKYNHLGGEVAVSCEKIGSALRIKVADTGPGISAEDMPRLFLPFERLGAGDTATEGAGLGLSLSKHIVEAMDGSIGVESTVGTGSTFWIELPLIPGTATERRDQAAETGTVPSTAAGQRTVLYVEDNLSNLRLVERILARRPGVTLLSAPRGSIGLTLAAQHQPDLILLDRHLPDMPGDEVLSRLRSEPATAAIPVVMISADANGEEIDRLRAAGAQDYLTKPIDVRHFLTVIDAVKPLEAGAPPLPPKVISPSP